MARNKIEALNEAQVKVMAGTIKAIETIGGIGSVVNVAYVSRSTGESKNVAGTILEYAGIEGMTNHSFKIERIGGGYATINSWLVDSVESV